MGEKSCPLFSFLSAAKGNWRNSVYIECGGCPYGKPNSCTGFLMIPDFDGQPVVIPAGIVQSMTGLAVDKEECCAAVSRQDFEMLYASWLEWHINSSKECAMLQIIEHQNCCNEDKEPKCCYQKYSGANAY